MSLQQERNHNSENEKGQIKIFKSQGLSNRMIAKKLKISEKNEINNYCWVSDEYCKKNVSQMPFKTDSKIEKIHSLRDY